MTYKEKFFIIQPSCAFIWQNELPKKFIKCVLLQIQDLWQTSLSLRRGKESLGIEMGAFTKKSFPIKIVCFA